MWNKGELTVNGRIYKYCIKHYDEPSEYGIMGGKISKLEIRTADDNILTCNYDRGWDLKAKDKGSITVLAYLLRRYNR
ncbi:MAG: hypothetical protein ACI4CX_01850 [Candidatus Weimeria sp.]